MAEDKPKTEFKVKKTAVLSAAALSKMTLYVIILCYDIV